MLGTRPLRRPIAALATARSAASRQRALRLLAFIGACCLCGLVRPAAAAPDASTAACNSGDGTAPRMAQVLEPLDGPEAGIVELLVRVSADGAVVDAEVVGGPDRLHSDALEAARGLTFAPATCGGRAVEGATRVSLPFDDPTEVIERVEIVAHPSNPDVEDTRSRQTLRQEELDRSAGETLSETLSQIAGVESAQGTGDTGKPIIRGHPERRLLVLFDGVRHESQKWGPDHGTEIDPFSAGSISVLKGPAGARYGPDAIGGVVLVTPPPLRSVPGVGGRALVSFAANGLRPYGALRLDFAPPQAPGLAFRIEGNGAVGSSLRAPDYLLGNTASRAWNLGGAVGYRWSHGAVRASWHHHDLQAGVFYGINQSSVAEFQARLDDDVPQGAELWTVGLDIDRPRQAVTHDIGALRLELFGAAGRLEATYAFQLNLRREFDQLRSTVSGPQYDFTLRTHSVDVLAQHPEVVLPFGTLEGGVGVQGSFQENVYRGFALLTNYRSWAGGVFGFERLSLPRVDVEVGGRFDGFSRAAFLSDRDYRRHERRGTLDHTRCEVREDLARCPTAFPAGSLSVGAVAHVVPDHLDVKVDLSTASRFPNVDEQYLLGSAPTFPVFATGNPSLGVETAWGASATVGLRLTAVELEVSGHGQLVDDYIYFAPELDSAGNPAFDVTIRGTWPRYGFQAIDAVFYGVDGHVHVWPNGPVGFDARGSVVRARERGTSTQLVGTPADRLHLALVGRPPAWGPLHDAEVRVTTDLVAQAQNVDPAVDFAPPPAGYALLGVSAETSIGDRPELRLGLDGRNLTNIRYREYTSLLRYYADQPGWDVRARLGVVF